MWGPDVTAGGGGVVEDMLPIVGTAIVVVLGLLFYLRARASRKGLRCPKCNEYMRIELMDTPQRCNTCGTPLDITEETHAQS